MKPFHPSWQVRCISCLVFLILAALAHGAQPSTTGLALWLDAADGRTLVRDADGRLVKWLDKSGRGNDAIKVMRRFETLNPWQAARAGRR